MISFALLSATPTFCQGMDFALSILSNIAAPVATMIVPDSVKDTVTGCVNTIYGESKDFENLFNEYTANRWPNELKDLVQAEIYKIEEKAKTLSNYTREGDTFNFDIQETCRIAEIARTWLLKYSLSILSLDYTHECKTRLDHKIKEAEGIKIKNSSDFEILIESSGNKNKEELREIELILDYLREIRLNLGAALTARYKYTRKGGAFDRYMTSTTVQKKRFKYWGVTVLPNINLSSPDSKIITILNSKTQISQCIDTTIDVYKMTFSFLIESTDNKIIECDDPYQALDFYREQFRQLFKEEPSEIKLTSKLVDAYNKVRDDLLSINMNTISSPKTTNEMTILSPRRPKSESISIANTNNEKRPRPSSRSKSEQSSLPINFMAAVNDYNSPDNFISETKDMVQIPLPKAHNTTSPKYSPKAIKTEVKSETSPLITESKGFTNIVDDYTSDNNFKYVDRSIECSHDIEPEDEGSLDNSFTATDESSSVG